MSVPTNGPTAGSTANVGDVQAAFAATLVDEWVRGGVRHAVVCPGSRSTPLALAVAAEPRLALHVRLDERSAGFLALGIGLASGVPAVVVVTSGTAAAELHPSVVEADLAQVPVIVCTADRPPELRDVGAPQTIDQTHLYGRAVRWFADPGVPDVAARASWRSLGARSVAEAVSGPTGPGPVHCNLPFREPLVGDAAVGGIPGGRADDQPWHRIAGGPVAPPPGLVEELSRSIGTVPGSRGLIVAGAGCGDAGSVLALAESLSWPVLADPRSGLRTGSGVVVAAADGILRAPVFAADHRPEAVLALGGRWASKVVATFLAGVPTTVVDPFWSWPDPERGVERLVRCDPTLLCRALGDALAGPGAGSAPLGADWLSEWQGAEQRARRAIEDAVDRGPGWDEPTLARRLVAALPAGVPLVVSSSMPVRDVEAFGAPRDDPPRVLVNRGANGIDGVVSTALGVAHACGPTVALVGDLAFLHDVSALVGSAGGAAPLTVVVADNGGGGIFSFLPQAAALDPSTFERLFGTPQAPDVAAVAEGLGWRVDEVDDRTTPGELVRILHGALGGGGGTVVRVRLPDRTSNVAAHDRINAAIVAAVDG